VDNIEDEWEGEDEGEKEGEDEGEGHIVPIPHWLISVSVFGIMVAVVVVVWKNSFIKSAFSCGWFGKIYVWLKLWLKLRLNKK
jgi:hypothetical protein